MRTGTTVPLVFTYYLCSVRVCVCAPTEVTEYQVSFPLILSFTSLSRGLSLNLELALATRVVHQAPVIYLYSQPWGYMCGPCSALCIGAGNLNSYPYIAQ